MALESPAIVATTAESAVAVAGTQITASRFGRLVSGDEFARFLEQVVKFDPRITNEKLERWFNPLALSWLEDRLYLQAPNLFHLEWVSRTYGKAIQDATEAVWGVRMSERVVNEDLSKDPRGAVPARPEDFAALAIDLSTPPISQKPKRQTISQGDRARLLSLIPKPKGPFFLHSGLMMAVEAIERRIFGPEKGGVCLVGPPGNGKSTLIRRAAMRLLEETGHSPLWLSLDDLSLASRRSERGVSPQCIQTSVAVAYDSACVEDLGGVEHQLSKQPREGVQWRLLEILQAVGNSDHPVVLAEFTGTLEGLTQLIDRVNTTCSDLPGEVRQRLASRMGGFCPVEVNPPTTDRTALISKLIAAALGKDPPFEPPADVVHLLDRTAPPGTSMRALIGHYVGRVVAAAENGNVTLELVRRVFGQPLLIDTTELLLDADSRRLEKTREAIEQARRIICPDIEFWALASKSRVPALAKARGLVAWATKSTLGETTTRDVIGVVLHREGSSITAAIKSAAEHLLKEGDRAERILTDLRRALSPSAKTGS